ncbi:hypothetical protein ACF1DV_23290 [Streptomyces achromogenes]|uniref:hypothetical protein n=1 Tax=Streptomyces achromogenes TaxID=67255 RepID=UPI003702DBBF
MTAGRLRRLEQASDRARARAREVQGQADAAWVRHLREVLELTDRAEMAESDAAILRELVAEFEAALRKTKAAAGTLRELSDRQEAALERADADASVLRERVRLLAAELEDARRAGRSLVLLLHWGEPHSIHAGREDAYAYAATRGVPVNTWGPSSDRPASEVNWRLVPFIGDETVRGLRSVAVPAPQGGEGAA